MSFSRALKAALDQPYPVEVRTRAQHEGDEATMMNTLALRARVERDLRRSLKLR